MMTKDELAQILRDIQSGRRATANPTVLLIDLSALFHPAWRANENGPVSVAYEGTLGGVRRCISTVNWARRPDGYLL